MSMLAFQSPRLARPVKIHSRSRLTTFDVPIVVVHDSHSSIPVSFMPGSRSGACAASVAETKCPPNPLPRPIPRRFCMVSLSMSCKLARCFFRGLPTAESSGKLVELKTLLGRVGAGTGPSVSVGGVAPRDGVPIEPGDLRELMFKGSAECCRLS